MRRTVFHVLLVAVIAGSLGVSLMLRGDPAQPNRRVPTNMADSVAYDSFAPNPVFADGKTLQMPPAGSIARGYLPLHYQAGPEEAERAGKELSNPFAADPVVQLERGAAIYQSFCVVCHGAGGLGDGPVTRRGVPPPPSLLAENALQLSDGQMFHILTYGQNNMASYAAQISRDDRWRVILHVRSLQGKLATSQPSTPFGATSPETSEVQP
ncbi:MAG TPA: cytochrome c [Phycisphaerae bacterium]|nr:cytochrome c [Phycisphaerae bacterium]